MKNTSRDQVCEGSTAAPHSVLNLRAVEKHLVSGGHAVIRKGLETVTIKQGPKDHKRSEVDGLLLSAMTVSPDGGPLATHINREKAVYIIREGAEHSAVASVSEYFVVTSESSSVPFDVPSPSLVSDTVRRRTSLALFASLMTVLVQSLDWLARNAQFFVRPYVLPVTVFAAV